MRNHRSWCFAVFARQWKRLALLLCLSSILYSLSSICFAAEGPRNQRGSANYSTNITSSAAVTVVLAQDRPWNDLSVWLTVGDCYVRRGGGAATASDPKAANGGGFSWAKTDGFLQEISFLAVSNATVHVFGDRQ